MGSATTASRLPGLSSSSSAFTDTTYYGGTNGLGSVYELHPRGNGQYHEHVLYSFQGGTDGNSSISNLVFDAAGKLYGTTSEGGAGCSCGTIFQLTPGANGTWTESVAYRSGESCALSRERKATMSRDLLPRLRRL